MGRILRARSADGCGCDGDRFGRQHALASRVWGFDFSPMLGDGETLASLQSVELTPSGLTLGSPSINGTIFTDEDGDTIQPSEGVLMNISGGTPGTFYEIQIVLSTSSGATIVGEFVFSVYDG